ncbi:MAG: NAD(P)/FAD-dependent oxidoreductase [Clostridiales bacterium]|nr:NAD(P)/FAD-dependent oxidoreductase [Clostridiales bacterium]
MNRLLIIGGGAAGMLAAVYGAEQGMEVHLFEQNEKLGKKLFITGKGRCNFTNACGTEELFESFLTNPRFLYSAVYGYTNYDVIDFFENLGVRTKMERGGRMFPQSDHSSDIILALERRMKELGVKIHLNSRVKRVLTEQNGQEAVTGEKVTNSARITGLELENGTQILGERVLIATGGNSYPTTGSTGDGYRMAKECGHTVTELLPSLVPMVTAEEYIPRMQGLSLKNVTLSVYDGKKCVFEEFGEMMFTHFGITGPLVLSASGKVGKLLKKKYLTARIDLKPALTKEQLDSRLLREFEAGKNKQFKNVIDSMFPSKMIPVMLEIGGVNPMKKVNEITKEERTAFIEKTKAFPMTITGVRGFREAIITQGGVQVKEVDPKTMESKKVKGLYFAGEVLDLDALTGGYNLQIAWSTAHAAALAAGKSEG